MARMPGLDTLRATAVVWVMLFHSYLIGGLGENFGVLERAGWMGVDLFFGWRERRSATLPPPRVIQGASAAD